MAEMSLAGVLEAPGKMVMKEFPLPTLGDEDGLLQVEMVGICSTDIKIYQGKITMYPLPLIMGHEIVGRIAKVGKTAARRWGVKEGDRVVLEASTSCGACEACLTGNYRFCETPLGYGLKTSCEVPPHLWGAYSRYMYIAPGSVVFPIKEDVPLKAAAMVTGILANGVQWICLLGRLTVGDRILIQGMGVQGLGAIVAAREAGAKEIIIAGLQSDRDRFALARRLGADHVVSVDEENLPEFIAGLTGKRGVDLVLDVTGRPQSIAMALQVVRKQGVIVEAGLMGGNHEIPFALDTVVQKEIRLQGARSKGYQATAAAVAIVESGKYPIEDMATDEYPLEQCAEALRVAAGETAAKPLKVMLRP